MYEEDTTAFLIGLIRQSVEKIEMNYLRSVGRGDEDPVVLLLDPRASRARAVLDSYSRPEMVAAIMARAAEAGMVPQVFSGLPRREALRIAGPHLPDLEDALEYVEAGEGYHVIAIGAGGYVIEAMPPLPGSPAPGPGV